MKMYCTSTPSLISLYSPCPIPFRTANDKCMPVSEGRRRSTKSFVTMTRLSYSPWPLPTRLRFHNSALEGPILRSCTKTGGVTDDSMPESAFTNFLKSTLTSAGYLRGPTIHAIRRELGKGVDNKCPSIDQDSWLRQHGDCDCAV
jgi:hypothetical protein